MAIASNGQYPSYLTVAPSYATRMYCVIVVLGVVDDVLVGQQNDVGLTVIEHCSARSFVPDRLLV